MMRRTELLGFPNSCVEDMAAFCKHGLGFVPINRVQEPQNIVPVVAADGCHAMEASCMIMISLSAVLATGVEHSLQPRLVVDW
jgi:hypothetical protein